MSAPSQPASPRENPVSALSDATPAPATLVNSPSRFGPPNEGERLSEDLDADLADDTDEGDPMDSDELERVPDEAEFSDLPAQLVKAPRVATDITPEQLRQPELNIGSLLGGRYELLEVLGPRRVRGRVSRPTTPPTATRRREGDVKLAPAQPRKSRERDPLL